MKKRVLSAALCLCLILGLFPVAALAATPCTATPGCSLESGHTGDCVLYEAAYQTVSGGEWSFGTLQDACSLVYSGGGVLVMRDIQLEAGVRVTKPLTITSNGDACYTVTYNSQVRGDYLLTAAAGGSNRVTLTNIILDGGSQQGHTSQNELVGVQSGQFALISGAVLQNNDTGSGTESAGGLRVLGGTVFVVTGAVIRNCRGVKGGGAALTGYGATLVVNGGVIENCEAFSGGGVFIHNNSAPSSSLFCRLYVQDGGIIRNNRAVRTMEGIDKPGPSQRGCGGGVYLEAGIINMPFQNVGGAVEGNYAQWEGGGIYTQNGTLNLYSGAVTGNRSEQHGGGVVVMSPSVTAILGGPITITDNASGVSSHDNLFLDFREDVGDVEDPTNPAWVIMPLTGRIGISRRKRPDETHSYRVAAISSPSPGPYGMHTVTPEDLAKFYSDNPRYVTLLYENTANGSDPDNGTIVITTADVVFDNEGHGPTVPGQRLEEDHKVAEPDEAEMTERGYTFRGWYEDEDFGTLWDFENRRVDETDGQAKPLQILHAKWDLNQYSIAYELDGGENAAENPDTYTVISADIYLEPPTREGYRFVRWEVVESGETATPRRGVGRSASPDIPTDSIGNWTFRAVWEELPKYTVTYTDGADGAAFPDQVNTDIYEGAATPGFDGTPARTGYTFTGWSPEVAGRVTEDAVYTARWEIDSYPVVFDVQGHGAAPEGQNVVYGNKAVQPEPLTESGWRFGGWYREAACQTPWDFETDLVTGPLTLYAKWTRRSTSTSTSKPSKPDPDPEEKPPYTPPDLESKDHFAYIVGYPDGSVRPEAHITRAEAAAIFFRLMTEEFRTENWAETNPFPDVERESWYNNAASTGLKAGLIRGLPDGTFGGDRPITRGEFAALAARFLSGDAAPDSGFPDLAGHWAKGEVDRAVAAGWIKGYPDGSFHPGDYITRAQVMTLVNRMLGRVPAADAMAKDMILWPDNPADAWYYADVQEATNGHTYEREGESGPETWTGLTENRDWTRLER